MKDRNITCCVGLVGVRLTLGLAILGMAWTAKLAEAKGPNRDDQNDSRANRNVNSNAGAAAPKFTQPTRQSPPPERAFRSPPRVIAADSNTSSRRQPTTTFSGQRSNTVDTRTWLAAGGNKDKDDQGGVGKGRGNTGGSESTPAPRREIQRDTSKSSFQGSGSGSGSGTVERRSTQRRDSGATSGGGQPPPPPPSNTTERSKISDVQKRLDSKKIVGSDAGSSSQIRRDDSGRKSDNGKISVEEKKIGPPPVQGDRTKAADVRKRLGGQGGDVIRSGKGEFKSGQPKIINTDTGKLVQPLGRPGSKDAAIRDANRVRFADQLKSGELTRVVGGETAKKIRLADQYGMIQQGDVARRLDLQKHAREQANVNHAANAERFRHGIDADHRYVFHPNFYHGVVGPTFARNSVQFYYWGPSFFTGLCWYPQWHPWVAWSWGYHCRAYWDPRPLWCRPVIYAPCPHWVYWSVPVWTPLPEVSCGTWVDLRPVVVEPAQSDLQLVAVRFVDPGHPEEKQGPRYRVWFRNAGDRPVGQPFNVMLFAANDNRLVADLPQAGVRVAALVAGGQQSVDIRLPVEVYAMGRDAQGKPAPFSTLHVLVDANREVPEATRINNGARLAPAEILPVDPAAFELDPGAAKPGAEVVLAGEGFGPEPGQILIHVGGQELQGEILGWYDLGVRWNVPKLPIAAPTDAEVIVVRGDGAAANPLKITITP
jgi:hypothetical protein